MSRPIRKIITTAASKTVQERLIAALNGLDVAWEGDETIENITYKLQQNLFQGFENRGEVKEWNAALTARFREEREEERQIWFEPYMPPIDSCYSAFHIGWRILRGEALQSIEGSRVREIANSGARALLKAWGEQGGELMCEPARYLVLESLRRSRAWIGLHLFVHGNGKRNLCGHCGRSDWELLGTADYCIALATGVDAQVVQTDWLIYRSQGRRTISR